MTSTIAKSISKRAANCLTKEENHNVLKGNMQTVRVITQMDSQFLRLLISQTPILMEVLEIAVPTKSVAQERKD
jgi:uncharacterized protein YjgD (DUF1641 family)